MLDEYLKANLASWDEAVGLHVDSRAVRRGRLQAGPLHAVGPRGRRARAVGRRGHHPAAPAVPLRPRYPQLGTARRRGHRRRLLGRGHRGGAPLADEVGLSARATFVQSDVLALPDVLQGSFDVVFSSWGALIWLGDLERWAQVVAHFLRARRDPSTSRSSTPTPSSSPTTPSPESLRVGYPYFQYGRPQRFDEPGDYADPERHDAAHRHLRVEPRLRRDPRPAAAQRPAPRLPPRVPLHHRRPAAPLPRGLRGRPAARQGSPRRLPAQLLAEDDQRGLSARTGARRRRGPRRRTRMSGARLPA